MLPDQQAVPPRYAAPALAVARAPVRVGPCKAGPRTHDPHGLDDDAVARDKKVRFQCPDPGCGKHFKNSKYRDEHRRQIHMGVKVKCPYGCGKKYQNFNRPSNLAKHFAGRAGSKSNHRDRMLLRLQQGGGDSEAAPMTVGGEALAFAQQLFRDARIIAGSAAPTVQVEAPTQVAVAELPFPPGYF